MDNSIEQYGWTAVPRSLDNLLAGRTNPRPPSPMTVGEIFLPEDVLSQEVIQYARENLPVETFNHSMRVYYYGRAITMQHFPAWIYTPQTLLLAALLHDIGTTPSNQFSTNLSFEFRGGLIALDLLKSRLGSPVTQAESVAETIIRHQDLGETGNVTTLTAVVHFATVLDNAGLHPELVHEATIRRVVEAYPRMGWTGCFGKVVREECDKKPWSNTTRIEGFAEMVEANEVMKPFD